jgi:hypothetical protein
MDWSRLQHADAGEVQVSEPNTAGTPEDATAAPEA